MFKKMINKVLGRKKDTGENGDGPNTIPASVLANPPSPPSNEQEGIFRDRSRYLQPFVFRIFRYEEMIINLKYSFLSLSLVERIL